MISPRALPSPRTDTELGQVASALNLAFDRHARVSRAPAPVHGRRLARAADAGSDDDGRARVGAAARPGGRRLQGVARDLPSRRRAHAVARRRSADARARRQRRAAGTARPMSDSTGSWTRPSSCCGRSRVQQQVTLRVSATAQTIAGDPDRLRELLSNLLFNGIAYNRPNGIVSIDVRLEHATRRAEGRGHRHRHRRRRSAARVRSVLSWRARPRARASRCRPRPRAGTVDRRRARRHDRVHERIPSVAPSSSSRFPARAATGSQMLQPARRCSGTNAMSGKVPE